LKSLPRSIPSWRMSLLPCWKKTGLGQGKQMHTVIHTENLTKRFGSFTAVDHVSFDIEAGEVVGYLGPNGSGKTTTMRLLLGLLTPSDGRAEVMGFDTLLQSEEVRRRVGYMSQKFSLYHDLTVVENLEFYAGVYGVVERQRVGEILEQMGLVDARRELVNNLSTGWRQRLALGTAIIHRPPILFLDEPTSGVDPTARRAFWDLIYTLVEQGVTALVTTHYMDEAEYCSRVGIMRDGRLLALDSPLALKEKYLQGAVWDIQAEPLLPVLAALEGSPLILRARLAGDHLSAITAEEGKAGELEGVIRNAGGKKVSVARVDPTLEDVFLTLALARQV
jgi:ABC-2 type transport system ATP-binding protein